MKKFSKMIKKYPISRFFGTIIDSFIAEINGNLPDIGTGYIIACNHTSFLDDIIIPRLIMKYTDKEFQAITNLRFYKNPIIKMMLNHYNCIPVSVKKDSFDEKSRSLINQKAIKLAVMALNSGKVIIIFPEGERSIDGEVKKGHLGVSKIAMFSNLPVIPIGIIGADKILCKGSVIIKPGKVVVNIGKPIYYSIRKTKINGSSQRIKLNRIIGKDKKSIDDSYDYKKLRKFTDKVMFEIKKLVKQ